MGASAGLQVRLRSQCLRARRRVRAPAGLDHRAVRSLRQRKTTVLRAIRTHRMNDARVSCGAELWTDTRPGPTAAAPPAGGSFQTTGCSPPDGREQLAWRSASPADERPSHDALLQLASLQV